MVIIARLCRFASSGRVCTRDLRRAQDFGRAAVFAAGGAAASLPCACPAAGNARAAPARSAKKKTPVGVCCKKKLFYLLKNTYESVNPLCHFLNGKPA